MEPGFPGAVARRFDTHKERQVSAITEMTRERGLEVAGAVIEPETGRSLGELDLIKDLDVSGSDVHLRIELLTPVYAHRPLLTTAIEDALRSSGGAGPVTIEWSARVRASSGGRSDAQPIPGVKNAVAVASGKGGVGKSTVAVNIAVAMAKAGATVGLLDTDVYGPSIPLMMGVHDKPLMRNNKIVPLEAHGVKVMSIGFILDPDKALIWRGPLVAQLITQFLNDVDWGELDYLILDLPPGTGDVQLTLVQRMPISGAVIVTTPQEVALADARKGLKMFEEVKTPILGIVENMSYFRCPGCGERHPIFGEGGGARIAEEGKVALLGQIPIETIVRESGDEGAPVVASHPESETARAFQHAAERIAGRLSVDAAQKPRKPTIMLKTMR
jgi:ATP-binding protein involved in chromosome partitioning